MGKIPSASTGGRRKSIECSKQYNREDLQHEVDRLVTAAFSRKTHLAYSTGLTAFTYFCDRCGILEKWPPSLDIVLKFIASLSLRGLAPSTVRSYVSSIGYI
ncbi:hypothetical protein SNE40_020691 [Patella caerulea]|uniref:Core-binding (CB) domain-containing protein n=1 Tax=Patella caerulea TaxID=87958 RepID=A0AAN8J4U6_PATCE